MISLWKILVNILMQSQLRIVVRKCIENWVSPLNLTDEISLGDISMMKLTLGDGNDYKT